MISDEYFIEMNRINLEKKKRKVEAKIRGDAFELVMYNLLKPKYKNLIDNNKKVNMLLWILQIIQLN